jgi:lysozyme family protein
MIGNYPKSLQWVLLSEAGWSNNPNDPGGPTMKGVTLMTFRHLIFPNATPADLRNISASQIDTIYRLSYWSVIQGDALPNGVDYASFDFAVNSGPGRAARELQECVGAMVDGSIGPHTLAAIAATDRVALINELCDKRLAYLEGLPTWHTFGHGWKNRVAQVRARALTL